MFEALRSHIAKYIDLSEEEFALGTAFFIPKKIKKKHFLLQEGEVCRHLAFVNKGCLRTYSIDDKGEEHVVQFAIEDWWINDPYSYLTGEPSAYNIDALEDSELLLLDRRSFEKLTLELPKFERFFRLLLENKFIAHQRRISAALSASAEERYLNFLKTYPAFARRIPQRHIASYLGITPEALSRIRRNLRQKNKMG
jgi:CRP-like cAMP-binding protein